MTGDSHSSGHQFDTPTALAAQIGGAHYKDCAIQPIEFIHANKLGYCEGNVVKYISRWRQKNGLVDLEKAKHYIDLLIELEGLNACQQKEAGANTASA